MNATHLDLTIAAGLILMTAGCGGNAEVARVATQAADRQAQQNDELARLNREVASGTKNLVDADAQARKELIAAQQQLQSQQAEVGRGRDRLEAERQEMGRERQTVSMWTPVLQGLGITLVAALTIGLCWQLLYGLRSDDDANQELGELLIMELSSDRPRLPSNDAKGNSVPCLDEPGPGQPATRLPAIAETPISPQENIP